MATALQEKPVPISEEDYLAGELVSETKHEYVDGQAYAMTGGTRNHSRISGNIFSAMRQFLDGKECEAFNTELKIKTQEGNFRYPDAMVVCDAESSSEQYSDSPVIIVEVLSSSTRRMDSVVKKREYLSIPTLQEYVLIEQDCVDVEVFRKENDWHPDHYFLGDEVHFASIGLTISVEEIYERVTNEDMVKFLQTTA